MKFSDSHYAESNNIEPVKLDTGNDVNRMLSIIQSLTGIVLYLNDIDSLRNVFDNPHLYFTSSQDIESINELKFLLNFEGASYEV